MCGRFTTKFSWRQIHEQLAAFDIALAEAALEMDDPPVRYNVAPTSDIPVLRAMPGSARTLETAAMRWWLVPSWSQEPTSKYATFNARAEDAATKPAFRGPFRRRRCLIPVSGFYEWRKIDDKTKQPYYITRADGELLYFAGLWDCWHDELESCTILTSTPNAEMAQLHNRMPCILEPEQVWAWVDPSQEDTAAVKAMLRPAPDGVLSTWPVSNRVGNTKNDDHDLIVAV